MKNSILFISLCLCNTLAYSQIPESIASDRPGNAYTSTVVGKGVFQDQNGIEFGRGRFDDNFPEPTKFTNTTFFQSNLIRFGAGVQNEINAAIDYRYSELERSNQLIYNSGISRIALGFRQNILQEKGNAPALGILVNANFNGLLNEYRDANPNGFVLFLAQKQLSNVFSFTTNIGFNVGDIFNQEELADAFLYTLNLGYSITPKLSGYIEGYGQIVDGVIVDAYDTGFGYLLNKDIQLDIYGGIYSEENYIEYFVTAGVSFRIGAN